MNPEQLTLPTHGLGSDTRRGMDDDTSWHGRRHVVAWTTTYVVAWTWGYPGSARGQPCRAVAITRSRRDNTPLLRAEVP
jgi:hypothetical protein